MHTVVTGGAGFTGSHLVGRLLAEGHTVEVVDDLSTGSLANLAGVRAQAGRDLRITRLDAASPDLATLFARRPPDVVYHLAAGPVPGAEEAARVVAAAVNVLDAARRGGAGKVVWAARAHVYGAVAVKDRPVRERQAHRPADAEGAAQEAVLAFLDAWRRGYGTEFTALVLATVYGPGQTSGAVADLARWVAGGSPPPALGSRDLLYVDDAVDALARAAGRAGGLVLNVGTGVATPDAEVADRLAALTGRDRPAWDGPVVAAEDTEPALHCGRAAIHLGWRPWTTVDDGLEAFSRGR
ncbi:MAG TPA: NAD-dependent epimerase/dehydratase family protein [Acidimicrobiales bacterium]|nr:NAD-dependent epimerase/dehydratase family protein [Acidimicrobiales bacterium]